MLSELKPEHIAYGLYLVFNEEFIELKRTGEVMGTFTNYVSNERILYEADQVIKRGEIEQWDFLANPQE